MRKVLKKKELQNIDAYFRAVNYLSVGQLYLMDNPLLKRPLTKEDIKPRIVGHWGTVPGQNFIYTHLNRIIKKYDLNIMYISGPGHGGQAMIANNYLDGTYSKYYENITEDEIGLKKLFKQFSFPGGTSSHVAPEVPGSIHEGGELGYSLSHAAGAVLDNPSLIVACVVGDGEAETGPLAASWNINKFLNPQKDGLGYQVYFVTGHEVLQMHQDMAYALECCIKDIKKLKEGKKKKWPLLVLTTPKGWTGPKKIHGMTVEGSFRSHQVPVAITRSNVVDLPLLEAWLKSYHPEQLFTEEGKLKPEIKSILPPKDKCMGASIYANGGIVRKEINTPDWEKYAIDIKAPGTLQNQDTKTLGRYQIDLIMYSK